MNSIANQRLIKNCKFAPYADPKVVVFSRFELLAKTQALQRNGTKHDAGLRDTIMKKKAGTEGCGFEFGRVGQLTPYLEGRYTFFSLDAFIVTFGVRF